MVLEGTHVLIYHNKDRLGTGVQLIVAPFYNNMRMIMMMLVVKMMMIVRLMMILGAASYYNHLT